MWRTRTHFQLWVIRGPIIAASLYLLERHLLHSIMVNHGVQWLELSSCYRHIENEHPAFYLLSRDRDHDGRV